MLEADMHDQVLKNEHALEVAQAQRFEFGRNWARFLREVNEERITAAVNSLRDMLGVDDLSECRFLDIGSGSGLFSLAARRLNATVVSFDYDPASVACTQHLKQRYYPQDSLWTVQTGSALDQAYLGRLGQYDVVYSWGVLHHTGDMWRALENAIIPCKKDGLLYIAIYNDQGSTSHKWAAIKRLHNRAPQFCKFSLVLAIWLYFVSKHAVARAMRFENPLSAHRSKRGMSWFRDVVDWVGGYPFEVARPEQIFDFYQARGFKLTRLKTERGHGCNEFVFQRER
jgi:2-polyprenyl-3-methyl-5-hydroxy-6-metoxy-1,4-benzoquinol methylase